MTEVWVAHLQESAAQEMTLEAAYACLKATPASTWESIEQARRQLVQLAHPERLVALGEDQALRAQSEGRRANEAHAVILRCRSARHNTSAN